MKRKGVAALVLAVLVGLAFVPAAVAGPPVAVSGTWSWVVGGFSEDKLAGGNLFFSGFEYGTWSGDLQGSSTDVFRGMFHRSGILRWAKFTITFTGSVLGHQGTMVMEMEAAAGLPADGQPIGTWVIKSGTGGLAGLRGEGRIDFLPDETWYSGKVHWE